MESRPLGAAGRRSSPARRPGGYGPERLVPSRRAGQVGALLMQMGLIVGLQSGLACSGSSEDPDPINRTRALLDATPPVERPNVLLIVVDTLRHDHLGAYGYERDTSPNIDALAARGIRYDRAYSQSSWTTPATAALLSSLHPSELGIQDQSNPLSDDVLLLPEALERHGYTTGGVVSHTYIAEKWNFDQGYDVFDSRNALGHDAVTSQSVSDLAIGFIEEHFREGPSFLLAHYFDPHFLYVDHEAFPFGDPSYDGWITDRMDILHLMAHTWKVGERDLARLVAQYDSEIAHTDRHIGRVLARLEELGLFDDTLIVFTADHGEEFLEHGSFNHALTLYEEQVHVPLIIKFPNASEGIVSDRVVQTIDVYPSVLEYLGIEVRHPISGQAIQSQTLPRPAFSETSRMSADLRAMVSGNDKIIWNRAAQGDAGRIQHFRLDRDPAEQHDLRAEGAGSPPDSADLLVQRLMSHYREIDSRAPAPALAVEVGSEERARLRALGYAQ